MKKALVILFAIMVLFGTVSCERSEAPTLVVWSFTDEIYNMITQYFMRDFPGVNIEYSMTEQAMFESRLDPVLASGIGVPDIIAMEASFVRKYIESGFLLDLTDIWEAYRDRILPYTVEVGMYNGRVYGLSWQATPGAFFFRRSLALRYLGTDDPEIVQTYFQDIDAFLATAQLLRERSNGTCVVVSSRGDIFHVMFAARENPWIVDGQLTIDPMMFRYMEISRFMHDQRLEGRVGQWSEGWFAGMRDELRDEAGNSISVFGYFLPTWGLHYILKPNTPETAGDWAMIQGPVPYRWGGTWLGAYRNTRHPEAARQLIRYLTVDNLFLEEYARNTGDFVSNMMVVERIKHDFYNPFLGGQNHYAEFARMAINICGRLLQGTDRVIEDYWHEAVTAFVEDEKTMAQALADFRDQVNSVLGL